MLASVGLTTNASCTAHGTADHQARGHLFFCMYASPFGGKEHATHVEGIASEDPTTCMP